MKASCLHDRSIKDRCKFSLSLLSFNSTDIWHSSPPPPTSVRDDRNPREYLPRYVDVDDDENEESGSYVQYHNDAVK